MSEADERVREAFRVDLEVGFNIVGLVYDIAIDDGAFARVAMTTTTSF